jgi:hypothetical protein
MPTTKKKTTDIEEKDTLFPEKVAHAREVLSKAKFVDPRFGGTRKG